MKMLLPVALAWALSTGPAFARDSITDAGDAPVEVPVWTHAFSGTLAGKPVAVTLQRIGQIVSGGYCYAARCGVKTPRLRLNGRIDPASGAISLHEEDSRDGKPVTTGQWRVQLAQGKLKGEWRDPNSARTLPVSLSLATDDAWPKDFEVRLLADAMPDASERCDATPAVSEVRLYRTGRRVQALATESQGTCSMFLPDFVDMDFDGDLDMKLATFLTAGPNTPYQYWLFDKQHDRFVDAPASLQDITSPEFDPKRHRIYNYWRAGAGSHGVDVWRWQRGKVVQLESRQSYFMPLRKGGKRGSYYVMPYYDEQLGRIKESPRLSRAKSGAIDPDVVPEDIEFERDWNEAGELKVWNQGRMERHPTRWLRQKGTPARWCPEITYYDVDQHRLGRELLTGDQCTDTDPTR